MFILSPKQIEIRILKYARESPDLLPSCMISRDFICKRCSLGENNNCILQIDGDFLSLLRWKISNLTKLADYDIPDNLSASIIEIFDSQGSALHVDKILSLFLRQNHPSRVNLTQIKKVLKSNPHIFKEKYTDVYYLNTVDEM